LKEGARNSLRQARWEKTGQGNEVNKIRFVATKTQITLENAKSWKLQIQYKIFKKNVCLFWKLLCSVSVKLSGGKTGQTEKKCFVDLQLYVNVFCFD